MSPRVPNEHVRDVRHPHWRGAAFLVEALLLLAFVAASLVVFTQVFAETAQRSVESEDLARAVALASSVAERFSADPERAGEGDEADGLRAVCEVTSEPGAGGVLYRADIRVYQVQSKESASAFRSKDANEPVYALSTAAYVSETATVDAANASSPGPGGDA